MFIKSLILISYIANGILTLIANSRGLGLLQHAFAARGVYIVIIMSQTSLENINPFVYNP